MGLSALASRDEGSQALYELAPERVVTEARRQAGDLTNPPWSFGELIDALQRAGVAEFSNALRDAARESL